jgi:hypothetical protein
MLGRMASGTGAGESEARARRRQAGWLLAWVAVRAREASAVVGEGPPHAALAEARSLARELAAVAQALGRVGLSNGEARARGGPSGDGAAVLPPRAGADG